jgi:NADH:ubiquinone oxidoreductase subunit E
MSLPIAGGGGAMRPPTHTPLDFKRLMKVAMELEDAFELESADALTPQLVEEIAADIGVSSLYVYAAAATLTEIPCDASDPVRFELCIGGCQAWGASELLVHLLKRREQADGPAFGIVAKRCLDKCDQAAVVFIHTPDGKAGLSAAKVADLDQALEQLAQHGA